MNGDVQRSLLLTGLCMHNLANSLRAGTISPSLAADSLDALACEVEAYTHAEAPESEANKEPRDKPDHI